MKFGQWIRNGIAAAALSMATCIPAQAAFFLIDKNQGVSGNQAFDYSFTPTQNGTITITLADYAAPVAFDSLTLEVNAGFPPPITPNHTSPFSFDAIANQAYSLTVFAVAGLLPGGTNAHFGKYHVTVSEAVPVPEPSVWLMMLGGIGLLGWTRLRKSESLR